MLAVFWRVSGQGFVAWDDDINVTDNPLLNPATLATLKSCWTGAHLRMYIPLTYSVWTGLAWLCRLGLPPGAELPPLPFHAANLAVHVLSAVAAFALFKTLLAAASPERPLTRERIAAAALGAAFFALHPLQVEVAAWVSGLRDALSGLFALLALQQATAFMTAGEGRGRIRYAAATAALAAAVLSKPSAVVIPALVIALDVGLLQRPWKKAALAWGPWLVLCALFSVLVQHFQGATHIRAMVPLWARPLIASDALAFYLWKLAWPFGLSPDYGRAADYTLAAGLPYWTWLAPAAVAAAAAWSGRRRAALCALALFILGVAPVLGFVPFLHQDLSTVADRYLYLSMLGPALALAWLLAAPQAEPAPPRAFAAAAALIAVLAAVSWTQIGHWQDTGTLFTRILEVTPDSGVAHLNLGNYLLKNGKPAEAEPHFRETLRLRPGDIYALTNLGNLYAQQGKDDEAISYYTQAIAGGNPGMDQNTRRNLEFVLQRRAQNGAARCDALQMKNEFAPAEACYRDFVRRAPGLAAGHNSLGFVLDRLGRTDEAVAEFRQAVRLQPAYRQAQLNLGAALARARRLDEAAAAWTLALEHLPPDAELRYNLGVVLAESGQKEKAAAQWREALRLNPGFEPARKALAH